MSEDKKEKKEVFCGFCEEPFFEDTILELMAHGKDGKLYHHECYDKTPEGKELLELKKKFEFHYRNLERILGAGQNFVTQLLKWRDQGNRDFFLENVDNIKELVEIEWETMKVRMKTAEKWFSDRG